MPRTDLSTLPDILLMGPGPSCVYPRVYEALSRPTLGHLDPVFLGIMDEIKEKLAVLFKAPPEGGLTLPLSGTGSSGMEAAFANTVEPGDRVLVLSNGVFGMRMQDVATRLRAEVEALEFDWGTPVLVEAVRSKLEQSGPYKIVAVVHAETSTGVANPVAEIARLLDEQSAGQRPLYLVDCVTSLGGMEVDIAGWGVDIAYSGTQKCLSCPPGLAPFTLSPRAVETLQDRSSKVPNWYLDVTMLLKYWGGGATRVYHHTAPINMLYALHAALDVILDEGLENGFARHRAAHEQLAAGLGELGLSLLVDPACRLPMLNAVTVPQGVDEAAVRKRLRDEFLIEIGAGLGPLAGKIWRIGLMGHTARPENVSRVLEALAACLHSTPTAPGT